MMTNDMAHARLQNQKLAGGKAATPEQALAWFGAMQAQDYTSVKWAIGARCTAVTDALVEQAIAHKTIVRTWLMRGTLQMAAAADVHWLLALLAPRLIRGSARRLQELELDKATLTRSFDVLTAVLQGGNIVSRADLIQALAQAGISTAGQRGYHILSQAAFAGLICFGPVQGKQQTFVLLDEWVPQHKKLEREEALAELTRRYFQSHGPATLPDFVWWSGLLMADARAGLEMARPTLHQETVAEHVYWFTDNNTMIQSASPTAYLLPGFDEYYLGYQSRHVVLDGRDDKGVISSNGIFRPIMVIDGQVVGIWKRAVKRGTAVISLEPFAPLTTGQKAAVQTAVEQYGAFLEMVVEVVE